jgi:hypothetical protein
MATKKIYTVYSYSRSGEKRYNSGTLEELIQYYSYTLEVGNSWNKKISRQPKTFSSFIKNVNASIDEKYSGYDRPYIYESETPVIINPNN